MVNSRPPFRTGNRVELLECGQEYFPALCHAIEHAEKEIYLETYIFADDDTGHRMADCLADAARRGVRVHVLVDGFGARQFPETLAPAMLAAGVEVQIFRPELARFSIRRHRLRRLHRKLVVIDHRLAFVGGINLIDDIHTPHQTPPRYDYAVKVSGPVVGDILTSCLRLWALVSWAGLRRRRSSPPRQLPLMAVTGTLSACFVERDNIHHRRDIEDAYLAAIDAAQSEIILANAYFLPGRRFRQALLNAAQRGVKVVLLLQGRVEYVLLHFATRALYSHFLTGGVHIFEYHRSFLHAKVAVVDGEWATVGSSNIDPFSLLLAREANLLVKDPNFADQLRTSLLTAMDQGAHEEKVEDWQRPPLLRRITTWAAYSTVRVLIGLAGIGGRI